MKLKHSIAAALLAIGSITASHAATIIWSSTAYVNTTSVGNPATKNVMGVDQFDQSGTQFLAVNVGGSAMTFTQTTDPTLPSRPPTQT